jgi:hypothetical protein
MSGNDTTRVGGSPDRENKTIRAALHLESRMGRPVQDEKINLLFGLQMLIGRDKSCEICLPDDRISRKHALLRIDPDAVRFSDLGSTNGSTRNGEPVTEEIILDTGDELCLGNSWTFQVRIVSRDERITSLRLAGDADVYLLVPQDFIIGFADPEAQDVDFKIYDPSILPRHAKIEVFAGHSFIIALDPSRPISVNSKPAKEAEIKNNYLIELGKTLIRFERSA